MNDQAPALTAGIYTILKDFQPLIGAVLALVTLAVGARIKFRYDRRRDDLIRGERKHSLHSSLYMETLLLCAQVGELGQAMLAVAQAKHAVTQELLDFYQLPVPVVYNSIVKDLGEMDIDVAADFVSFYAHYGTLVRDVALLVRDVPERGVDHVLRLLEATIDRGRRALANVDKRENREDPSLPCTKEISEYLAANAGPPEAGTLAASEQRQG